MFDDQAWLFFSAIAISSGLFVSASNNIIAWPKHIWGPELFHGWKGGFLFFISIVLNLAGVGAFLKGAQFGPVAVLMPFVTATKLLTNMVFQHLTGIEYYTKDVRVGTCVLAAAVALLADLGPAESTEPVDVDALFENTIAVGWIVGMGVLLIVTIVLHKLWKPKPKEDKKEIIAIILSVIVGVSTALGATFGKFLWITEGFHFGLCVFSYLLCGVISFGWNAIAAYDCDMAFFLPVSECIQLLVNCWTGLAVWGDRERIPSLSNYTIVYCLIVFGTYSCGSLDIVSSVCHETAADVTMKLSMRSLVKMPWFGHTTSPKSPNTAGTRRKSVKSLRKASTAREGLGRFAQGGRGFGRKQSLTGKFKSFMISATGRPELDTWRTQLEESWKQEKDPVQMSVKLKMHVHEAYVKHIIGMDDIIDLCGSFALSLAGALEVMHRKIGSYAISNMMDAVATAEAAKLPQLKWEVTEFEKGGLTEKYGGSDEYGDLKKDPCWLSEIYQLTNILEAKGEALATSCRAFHHLSGTECVMQCIRSDLIDPEYVDCNVDKKLFADKLKLRHPNVKRFLDILSGPAQIFVASEPLKGEDLMDYLLNHFDSGEVNEQFCQRAMKGLMSGLAYIHHKDREIVHRCVCLTSLQFKAAGGKPSALVLTHFANSCKEGYPQKSIVIDHEYRAPEVTLDSKASRTNDVWSAGVVLYVLLTGRFLWPRFDGLMKVKTAPPDFNHKQDPITQREVERALNDLLLQDNKSNDAKEFLSLLLVCDAKQRKTAEEATKHVWIESVTEPQTSFAALPPTFIKPARRGTMQTGEISFPLQRQRPLNAFLERRSTIPISEHDRDMQRERREPLLREYD
eukprot:TRINITY_DN17501_c0_g1_i1.p1 TRINITY_DN17501_c0_g1~~TRINITY_DN17501_c0_g1_i1.p1  ORF type:complete len:852 (-),score=149.17 TRINITY_DN17501_c0_g1_i1:207-2762(-)